MLPINRKICRIIQSYSRELCQNSDHPIDIPSRKLLKRIQDDGIALRSRPLPYWVIGTLHIRYLLVRSGSFHFSKLSTFI